MIMSNSALQRTACSCYSHTAADRERKTSAVQRHHSGTRAATERGEEAS
jgi:hypothetical protein